MKAERVVWYGIALLFLFGGIFFMLYAFFAAPESLVILAATLGGMLSIGAIVMPFIPTPAKLQRAVEDTGFKALINKLTKN